MSGGVRRVQERCDEMNALDELRARKNSDPNSITELEWTILLADGVAIETRRKAAAELEGLRARVDALEAERDAWRDYAQHQEWCQDCALSVNDCETGSALRAAALGESHA